MLLLINSARPAAEHGIDQLTGPMDPTSVVTLAATKMAQRHTGRPVPNAALLGGFAALSGWCRWNRCWPLSRSGFRLRSPAVTSRLPARPTRPSSGRVLPGETMLVRPVRTVS